MIGNTFSVRASDVDDLILNVLGVVIGYGIYAAVKRLKRQLLFEDHR